MTTPKQLIFDYLIEHPEGANRGTIMRELALGKATVHHNLKNHPYIYIDRWEAYQTVRGPQWRAVYAATRKPDNTPKPNRRPTQDDLEMHQ